MPVKKQAYTFEQFAAIRRYQGGGAFPPALSFSPDGSAVAYTVNTSGQFNLWRQPSQGGLQRQLTLYTERAVRAVAWSPDGRWIAYNADHHGDEFHQLFRIPPQGGRPEQLTDAGDVQHHLSPGSWSPTGRYLAYSANDRDRTAMDVLVRDLRTGGSRRLLAGDANYVFGRWSPDGRHILAVELIANTDTNLHLITVKDGSSRLLTPHEGEVIHTPGPWAPDGSGFYMGTNAGREFEGLAFFNLRQGRWAWVETPPWDLDHVAASRDGRILAWVVNQNGYGQLHAHNLRTGRALGLPVIPRGFIQALAFSRDGARLGLIHITPTHCSEVFVIELARRRLIQLTESMLGGIRESHLVRPQAVRFPTFDGRRIPALLYRPRGAGPARRAPVVLSIHGGPEMQERPAYVYSGLYQFLLSRGIGVLAPNIRGSSGYGKSYQTLIHRDWGGDELKDIEAAARYLQALPWVDPRRMAVFGGSFGGFATLSAASRLPDYWAAAVDVFGPSNLVTFVKAVPPFWRRWTDAWVGHPERDRAMLMERSPITHVDRIKAPLLVIQGAKDPRVVKAESDQIVERLRARGVEVRYQVFEDEGHGFTKRVNELKAWGETVAFMEEHLLTSRR
jgi:dipeptidyl aminopeptidase/acylaminoacyl peptidase